MREHDEVSRRLNDELDQILQNGVNDMEDKGYHGIQSNMDELEAQWRRIWDEYEAKWAQMEWDAKL